MHGDLKGVVVGQYESSTTSSCRRQCGKTGWRDTYKGTGEKKTTFLLFIDVGIAVLSGLKFYDLR